MAKTVHGVIERRIGPDIDILHPRTDDKIVKYNDITVYDAIEYLKKFKVDKIVGKGLTENDFTDEYKDKLDGIENYANNYVLPIATEEVLGGAKLGYKPECEMLYIEGLDGEISEIEDYAVLQEDGTNRNYPVEIDENNRAYVEVQWQDIYDQSIYHEVSHEENGTINAATQDKLESLEWDANKYILPVATEDEIGGIKLGYKPEEEMLYMEALNGEIIEIDKYAILQENGNSRNYGVELDDENNGYVEVPWTNTIYGPATKYSDGLISVADKAKIDKITLGSLKIPEVDNAGSHNCLYRGKEVNFDEAIAAIKSGNFTNLFIGDYFIKDFDINGTRHNITFVAAGFDVYSSNSAIFIAKETIPNFSLDDFNKIAIDVNFLQFLEINIPDTTYPQFGYMNYLLIPTERQLFGYDILNRDIYNDDLYVSDTYGKTTENDYDSSIDLEGVYIDGEKNIAILDETIDNSINATKDESIILDDLLMNDESGITVVNMVTDYNLNPKENIIDIDTVVMDGETIPDNSYAYNLKSMMQLPLFIHDKSALNSNYLGTNEPAVYYLRHHLYDDKFVCYDTANNTVAVAQNGEAGLRPFIIIR